MTRYFTKDHEWIDVAGDTGTVGITDYAQGQLGDITFVELPAVGTAVGKGDAVAVELHVAQVPGIAAFGEQPFEHFGIADIPAYAGFVGREQSHDGRCPAAVAYHGAAGHISHFIFHVRIDCFAAQM